MEEEWEKKVISKRREKLRGRKGRLSKQDTEFCTFRSSLSLHILSAISSLGLEKGRKREREKVRKRGRVR